MNSCHLVQFISDQLCATSSQASNCRRADSMCWKYR